MLMTIYSVQPDTHPKNSVWNINFLGHQMTCDELFNTISSAPLIDLRIMKHVGASSGGVIIVTGRGTRAYCFLKIVETLTNGP